MIECPSLWFIATHRQPVDIYLVQYGEPGECIHDNICNHNLLCWRSVEDKWHWKSTRCQCSYCCTYMYNLITKMMFMSNHVCTHLCTRICNAGRWLYSSQLCDGMHIGTLVHVDPSISNDLHISTDSAGSGSRVGLPHSACQNQSPQWLEIHGCFHSHGNCGLHCGQSVWLAIVQVHWYSHICIRMGHLRLYISDSSTIGAIHT